MEFAKATGRLLLITVLVVLGASIPLFWSREVALNGQKFQADNLMDSKSFWYFMRADEETESPYSKTGFLSSQRIIPDCVLTADLRPTKDHQWVIFGRDRLEDLTDFSGKIEDYTLAELRPAKLRNGQPMMSLDEFLQAFRDGPLAFVIHSREVAGVKQLLKNLEGIPRDRKIFLMSSSQALLRDMRKARPDWRFGSDAATLAKIQLLTAIYLEPLLDIWADFIVSPIKIDSSPALSPRAILEAQRRRKPLFIETNGLEDIPPEWEKNASGVLTARPRWAKAKFLP